MAYDLKKFEKFVWVAGLVGFYQVYVAKNPADPFGQMWTDLQYYMNGLTNGTAWTKIQTKMVNIATVIILLVLSPAVIKMLGNKVPGAIKVILNAGIYYYLGDQIARILDDPVSPMTYGRPQASVWSQPTSAYQMNAYTPSTGVIKNIYSS